MELQRLTTEARNPASEQIDRLSALEIVRLMNAQDATIAAAVGSVLDAVAEAVEVITDRLRQGGRLVYAGAGTSGRLGVLDASECPPTFNTRPWQVVGIIAGGLDALVRSIEGAEDSPDAAVADLQRIALGDRDVLVGIATSGRTPYVLSALRYANQVGAFTIGLSCNADSQQHGLARLNIVPVVGPEVISGSTRMKAGTATKMVLNMLTTAAMVRLGKTYGNLMVDLQATNQKLADRSRRIVMHLAEVSAEQADRSLQQSGGDVKSAIVAHCRAVSPSQARRLLDAAGGQLRGALELPLPQGAQGAELWDESAIHAGLGAGPLSGQPSPDLALELVLGVDGGGTKTLACLASRAGGAEVVVSRGMAGSSNPQAVGWKTACDNLQCAIDRAFQAAELAPAPVWSVCLAVAGAGRAEDQARLRQWAERIRLARRVIVTHDALAVLAAANPDAVGIALISGTGSIAFGRDARGQTARAGGWGSLFGDEGSGLAIARDALRAAAGAIDGRSPPTRLVEALLHAYDARTPQQLLPAVYQRQTDTASLAGLAKTVAAVAEQGDTVAQRILQQAASDLAAMYRAVGERLRVEGGEPPSTLALAGGTLIEGGLLREYLLSELRSPPVAPEHGQRPWRPPAAVEIVREPVAGALRIAYSGLTTD